MDRLPTLMLLLFACGKSDPAGDPPSRTNGAKVAARQAATTDAFCDQHGKGTSGPLFQWPENTVPGPVKGWRWINVWATWCKPCLEEMPRLARWRDKLAASGTPIDLSFISIDESDEDVIAYRKLHPDAPPSTRVPTKDKATAWLAALGLDGAAIPVHIFVEPGGHVRCARAGGVREDDYAVVTQLFAE